MTTTALDYLDYLDYPSYYTTLQISQLIIFLIKSNDHVSRLGKNLSLNKLYLVRRRLHLHLRFFLDQDHNFNFCIYLPHKYFLFTSQKNEIFDGTLMLHYCACNNLLHILLPYLLCNKT